MLKTTTAAIEALRQELHATVDRSVDDLLSRLTQSTKAATSGHIYKDPTDADCRDPRVKNGNNFTPDGLEILFRLLDKGAGYNSAGRKLSITQTAVKNRKKDWIKEGGLNRQKSFIPWLDAVA